jgi:hypothetical protein
MKWSRKKKINVVVFVSESLEMKLGKMDLDGEKRIDRRSPRSKMF